MALCFLHPEQSRLIDLAPYNDQTSLVRVIRQSLVDEPEITSLLPRSPTKWIVYNPSGIIRTGVADTINAVRKWLVEHRDAPSVNVDELMADVLPLATLQPRSVPIIVTDADMIEALDTFGTPYEQAFSERGKMARKLNATLPSPSDALQHPEMVLVGADKLHPGRPHDNHGLSTALFDRSLGRLAYDLANLDRGLPELEPTPLDCQWVRDFVVKSLETHTMNNEDAFGDALPIARPQLASLMAGVVGDLTLPSCILEYNKVFGDQGDASLQGVVVYMKIVTHPNLAPQLAQSNLPMVVISVMGNFIEISGTIYTDGAYMTTYHSERIDLSVDADGAILRLARAFKAVRICIKSLEESRHDTSRPRYPLAYLFPSPLPEPSYKQEDKDIASIASDLRFTDRMRRNGTTFILASGTEDRHSRVFLATFPRSLYSKLSPRVPPVDGEGNTDQHIKVVVKFTRRYNEEAHRKLAELQLAPALLACVPVCDRSVPRSTKMVIMEYVDGQSVFVVQRDSPEGTLLPRTVYEDVEKAIKLLHADNLVYGDLRTSNMMVVKDGRGMLIDFDWVGEHGQARYPTSLNCDASHKWHEEVRPYGLMKKEHDDEMLKRLETLCAPA